MELPFGFETKTLFWLMGWGVDGDYKLWDNAKETEAKFWNAFWSSLPSEYRTEKGRDDVQFGMKLGAALTTSLNGVYNPGHFASFRRMLDYVVPGPVV